MDLIDLYDQYRESGEFAHLTKDREGIRFVPGRGATRPAVMIIGEAPGSVENLNGKPFVGPSGRLLDQLMALAGLRAEPEYEYSADGEKEQIIAPDNVFITNTVKYQPPGNRNPTRVEIAASRKWIRKEWKILGKPRVMVTVGAVPLACVAPQFLPISRWAGEVQTLSSDKLHLWPMFHPAYALRNQGMRPIVERHWEQMGSWIKKEGLI